MRISEMIFNYIKHGFVVICFVVLTVIFWILSCGWFGNKYKLVENTEYLRGTSVTVKIYDDTGGLVQEFVHDITEMTPGSVVYFNDSWNTSEVTAGAYTVVGYVTYDSKATEARSIKISTSCLGDFDHDGDVDSLDLAVQAGWETGLSLSDFAGQYGQLHCFD